MKQEQEEQLRPQPQKYIPSQPQLRQAGFLASKKARRSVLLGSTSLGLGLIALAFVLWQKKEFSFLFFVGNGTLFYVGLFFLRRVRQFGESASSFRLSLVLFLVRLYGVVSLLGMGGVVLGSFLGVFQQDIFFPELYKNVPLYFLFLIVYLTSIYIGRW
ncbi:hypothetical protein Cri9333_3508 [Crinalium epipsammum PCC 9333]|uniref:Uncharacterized protein n=1 Tax=Crinalium epipsammum PCC 9333 TaxID=1173022 RepID=K9W1T8_9CYAN|nr:hypothetical protein [Crinalium epipsammum]AFZ14333.1 hypothetical protein Cri9333_3508 [Crinalium epipsammum PCC 9333]